MTITDLLDGVEPDAFGWEEYGFMNEYSTEPDWNTRYEVFEPDANDGVRNIAKLYSRETVEALLETHRKQVLLEAAEAYLKNDDDQLMNEYVAEWLRRMAIESTVVDKEGKE
jgi:hypothetical protein